MRTFFRMAILASIVTLALMNWLGSRTATQEEQAAKQLGFIDRAEYKEAEKAGFKDVKAYRAHHSKVADDKVKAERAALWDAVDRAVSQLANTKTTSSLGNSTRDATLLLGWRGLYFRANTVASSVEEKKKLDLLEERLQTAQKAAFPRLRSAYIKEANEKLWIEDGKVKSGGSGRIVFYHGSFLLNRNIQKMADKLHSLLSVEYRFKQLCFAPYEGSNMTCYDLSPSADSSL